MLVAAFKKYIFFWFVKLILYHEVPMSGVCVVGRMNGVE